MPKTLSNQKKKQNNMPITEAEKQKFKEYLKKRDASSIKESSESLLEYCVNDIFEKAKSYNQEMQKYSDEEIQTFNEKLGLILFNKALLQALDDNHNTDSYLLQELIDSENLEEILLKVGLYIETFPDFSYRLTIYLLISYMQLCIEYSITPDLDLQTTLQIFLEK